ncbi:SCP2 sterol-binding domain-containing protein [Bacillaceae bacterium W0354]
MKQLLDNLVNQANNNPEHLNGLKAKFSFDITDQEDVCWSIDFAGDSVQLIEGPIDDAKCTFKLSEKNFEKLIEGTLNPTTAFMMGKIKVNGDLTLALKLQQILSKYR